MTSPTSQSAVRWYPPSFDIRVEEVSVPEISEPDDAIVKVKNPHLVQLAALCGSDLHIYRGHAGVTKVHICGHEFIGEVVKLGSSYGGPAQGRPDLYSTLKVGDKVVSPFTVSCGECSVCRLGYTCRCPHGALFGSPVLEGGQAQYVRVPKAGGTLYNLSDTSSWSASLSDKTTAAALDKVSDSSLVLLADILPTGVFAAMQALSHPKVLTALTGRPCPLNFFPLRDLPSKQDALVQEDRTLTFAIVGLGPVGICAAVSLLDLLSTGQYSFRVVAIDPIESRREKMEAVYSKISPDGRGSGEFIVASIEDAKTKVQAWTSGVGCTAVLEVVGNNSALSLAYDLVRDFGAIISVGVHGANQVPFTGRQLYNKNVSLEFGRCPARTMFPPAFELLVKRQDVFGGVGDLSNLVDRIVGFDQAPEMYRAFEKGDVGKVIFDPWK
ncbi:alcohol dehydrogenase [Armillaria novae-zelandiae]|uniref:Alcohol dehydrogenase n=1 Tax=Armillaria novae-zelandiae TaxID=153914 RepID=A0AA39P1W9_9AGAR|nr:alcohol dehydrogenase [Armillaria novae-zelandiae]